MVLPAIICILVYLAQVALLVLEAKLWSLKRIQVCYVKRMFQPVPKAHLASLSTVVPGGLLGLLAYS